jgi:hypothetical protein
MFASALFPVALTMLAGPASVQGHAVMNNPRHLDTATYLETGPLGTVGGLYTPVFPCHDFLNPDPGHNPTAVKAGDQLQVSFTIGAEHHGGSCQFSVAYDDPTLQANWKVIYSIVGGCPANLTFPLNDGFDTDSNFNISKSEGYRLISGI